MSRIAPVTYGHAMTIEPGDVPRYQQLASILREQIARGELLPHTPIPSKKQLRQAYGIAGQTVDKAIQILKDEGMVHTVPGLGIFVRPRKDWLRPTYGL